MGVVQLIASSSLGAIGPWLFLAIAISALIWQAYIAFRGPLSDVPACHWLAPWTRYHNLYIKYFHSISKTHHESHKRHRDANGLQPIIRVGPNEVSIASTEAVRTVFGGNFERSDWYGVFSNFGSVFDLTKS